MDNGGGAYSYPLVELFDPVRLGDDVRFKAKMIQRLLKQENGVVVSTLTVNNLEAQKFLAAKKEGPPAFKLLYGFLKAHPILAKAARETLVDEAYAIPGDLDAWVKSFKDVTDPWSLKAGLTIDDYDVKDRTLTVVSTGNLYNYLVKRAIIEESGKTGHQRYKDLRKLAVSLKDAVKKMGPNTYATLVGDPTVVGTPINALKTELDPLFAGFAEYYLLAEGFNESIIYE